ncbi:unnamed protein product [Moneuplotes crassus]|uniref:Uncharacterized protein n=2 Tax=Euplotes crassus TaxID=5936 RepID=A0AAD1Y179_EUPCR|nr:unnamed protein product [Moneuplotes crassus]
MEKCIGQDPMGKKKVLLGLEVVMLVPYVIMVVVGRGWYFDITGEAVVIIYNVATIIMLVTQLAFIILYYINSKKSVPSTHNDTSESGYIHLQESMQNPGNQNRALQNRGANLYSDKFWNGPMSGWILYRSIHAFILLCMWITIFFSGYHEVFGYAFFIIEVALFFYSTFEWYTLVDTPLNLENDYYSRI